MNNHWNLKNTYEKLPEEFYSKVKSSPVKEPRLVILNEDLANDLGLIIDRLRSEEGVEILSGNRPVQGEYSISQAYAGHQFGHFTMLGDGRAILIGEQVTPSGKRYDLQLKGSGRTPYSRGGDGRATLGPMLREYLISEAMHGLGIPTSRSLAVIETGEKVRREQFQPGAILTRVAKSHLRIGTIQYAAAWTSIEKLKTLVDYGIQRHDSECKDHENPYFCFYKKVLERQAKLIAKWQRVGFIHGVMNTDNMTLNGETIDYGPCAFMDEYKENTVFSSIDHYGRYSYGNQPKIGAWNLARLAESLVPLFHREKEKGMKLAEEALEYYEQVYRDAWLREMGGKLGLKRPEEKHRRLIHDLLDIMEKQELDYTNTFLALLEELMLEEGTISKVIHFLDHDSDLIQWKERWKAELIPSSQKKGEIIEVMKAHNPRVIPRNHLVEDALKKYVDQQNSGDFIRLLEILKTPYDHERFFAEDKVDPYQKPGPKDGKPYQTFCGT